MSMCRAGHWSLCHCNITQNSQWGKLRHLKPVQLCSRGCGNGAGGGKNFVLYRGELHRLEHCPVCFLVLHRSDPCPRERGPMLSVHSISSIHHLSSAMPSHLHQVVHCIWVSQTQCFYCWIIHLCSNFDMNSFLHICRMVCSVRTLHIVM